MKKLHINTYRNLSLKIKISILSIFSVIALSVFVFNTSENKNNSSLFLKADVGDSCILDGVTIPNNGQQTFYVNTSSTDCESSTNALLRTCINGDLSGDDSFKYKSCSAAEYDSCILDGVTIPHNGQQTFYVNTSSADCESSTNALLRTCTNGDLSGDDSFKYKSCSAYDSCTLDGVTIASGQTITAFTKQEDTNCASLESERTCTDGELSGDTNAIYRQCQAPGDCTGPGNTIVKNGESRDFWHKSDAINCSEEKESRSCLDGTLDGSAIFTSCGTLNDYDGDGIPDITDPDDDNDGVNDISDRFPLDATEWIDTDNDGIGNNADTDDDGDGVPDSEEQAAGTDPLDPSSKPSEIANYELCEIYRDENTNTINWTAEDYIYTKTTIDTYNQEVKEEITDIIQSGKFVCDGIGENHTEGSLSNFPTVKTGTLTLPTGFPLLNSFTCKLEIKTKNNVYSSCEITEKLLSINTVSVNGETGKTWHIPLSVKGTKNVPIAYGGSTHEIYAESEESMASAIQTEVILIADKKSDEVLNWSSPNGETGTLYDYIDQTKECSIVTPCTGEKVIFKNATKLGTSSILFENKTTHQTESFTMHILPSAIENIVITNEEDNTYYTDSKISLNSSLTLFNGENITASQDQLIWEFTTDGGATWITNNQKGTIIGGEFIANEEGLFGFRAKAINNFSGFGEENLHYKPVELFSENTIQINIKKALDNAVIINGEKDSFIFPVSQVGTKSIIKTYGGGEASQPDTTTSTVVDGNTTTTTTTTVASSSITTTNIPLYTHKVSTETGIVLIVNTENTNILEWSSANTETGTLTDYKTGAICSIATPCKTTEVLFTGGTKEGDSSILLKNTDKNTSITYTVTTLPSATESLQITNNTDSNHLAGYINSEIPLLAEKTLFNGNISDLSANEVIWEFSTDGGTTFTQNSQDGIISSGMFIPKTSKLFSIRAKIYEQRASQDKRTLKYYTHEVVSENILTINVTDVPYWNVLINGKSGNWNFPIAQKNALSSVKKISYGNQTTSNTDATTPTPTPVNINTETTSTASDTSAILNLTEGDNTSTTDTTQTNESSNTEDIDFTQYTKVATYNEIELIIDNKNNDEIAWYSDSGKLYESSQEFAKQCTENSPCSSESVTFIATEDTGVDTVILENKTLNQSITYTVTTLPEYQDNFSITTEKSAEQISENQFFANEQIKFYANTNLSGLIWEFSYDGGTTWAQSSDKGIISAGIFIPKISGLVSIRSKLYQAVAQPDINDLIFTKYDTSSQVEALQIDESQIKIDSAHIIGSNIITRNTEKKITASLSSREAINNLQSLSVGLFTGNITAETYANTDAQSFIFKEYHNETPVKDYLESSTGEQNRGIIELPVFIPEYDKQRYMPDGNYTLVLELYRDDRVISRYFIPTILGNNFATCDVNDDGFENLIDLILSLKFLNGSLNPSQDELERVDKNRSGIIDLQDILILFPCITK